MSLVPTSGKAEWMITYRCNLDCHACTRASFLSQPIVRDMTLADAEEFCRQADEIDWHPRIVIIGGEPTLHKLFEQFCLLAQSWSKTYAQVFSNGHGQKVRERLIQVESSHSVSICRDGEKPSGSVMPGDLYPGWDPNTFVSPVDAGVEVRGSCWMHASQICGVSVDAEGYAPCAPGGAVAALVAPRGRTKHLADLFDPEKVQAMTDELCRHCGSEYNARLREIVTEDIELGKLNAYAETLPRKWNTLMSPTWAAAFEGRK